MFWHIREQLVGEKLIRHYFELHSRSNGIDKPICLNEVLISKRIKVVPRHTVVLMDDVCFFVYYEIIRRRYEII